LGSLKRSSLPLLTGFAGGTDETEVALAELAGGSDVSEALLPHNARTVWEIGWVGSPT
jgi:hypothetical protein